MQTYVDYLVEAVHARDEAAQIDDKTQPGYRGEVTCGYCHTLLTNDAQCDSDCPTETHPVPLVEDLPEERICTCGDDVRVARYYKEPGPYHEWDDKYIGPGWFRQWLNEIEYCMYTQVVYCEACGGKLPDME